jgi:hypothetical protein
MSKLEYGGFDASFAHMDDDGWTNLKTVHEFLQDGAALPPDLARWLGHAIRYSIDGKDAAEFVKRLGLKKRRGRPSHKHDAKDRLRWGERVWELEQTGLAVEAALALTADEYSLQHSDGISRSLLQTWRDDYHSARYPGD